VRRRHANCSVEVESEASGVQLKRLIVIIFPRWSHPSFYIGSTVANFERTVVEVPQLGGAFATGSGNGGVVDHLDAAYAYLALGLPSPVASAEDNNAQLARLRNALKAWNPGYTSPTFVDNYHQPQRSFDDVTAARVATVRAEVDPWGSLPRRRSADSRLSRHQH
jgi:hypothetical protein